MMLKTIVTLILGLLLPFAVLAQQGVTLELERVIHGDIEIAADGSVHAHTIDEKLTDDLRNALDRSIRQWRFEPITVDGRPVIAITRMTIDLALVPLDDGKRFQFRLAHVWFGGPTQRKLRPPFYPNVAGRAGVGAKVVLVLELDPQGEVTRIHTEQVSLTATTRTEAIAERWRAFFREASIKAARKWTFNVAEIVNGEPVGTSVRVPVEFLPPGNDGGWQVYVPGPYRPVPWISHESLASDSIDELGNGDVQPLGSRFKLQPGVIGSML